MTKHLCFQQQHSFTRKGDFVEKEQLEKALKEIIAITEGLTVFNPTYEKIYNIAISAIGGNKDD